MRLWAAGWAGAVIALWLTGERHKALGILLGGPVLLACMGVIGVASDPVEAWADFREWWQRTWHPYPIRREYLDEREDVEE